MPADPETRIRLAALNSLIRAVYRQAGWNELAEMSDHTIEDIRKLFGDECVAEFAVSSH